MNPGVAAGNESGRVYNPTGRDEDGKYQYDGQSQQFQEDVEYHYKDVHSSASEQYEVNKDASDVGNKNFGDQSHTSYKKSYVGSKMGGMEEAEVESWDPNKV